MCDRQENTGSQDQAGLQLDCLLTYFLLLLLHECILLLLLLLVGKEFEKYMNAEHVMVACVSQYRNTMVLRTISVYLLSNNYHNGLISLQCMLQCSD